MNHVYLSLGSNRGNREEYLKKAVDLLGKSGKILRQSSLYETEPWNMNDDTNFLNQVILLETDLPPERIMDVIIHIEESMGRIRSAYGYQPRTIDIDILFFNDKVLNTSSLIIPHPHIHDRRFVLEPLVEIAPKYIHPVLKKSVKHLLAACPDHHSIAKFVSK